MSKIPPPRTKLAAKNTDVPSLVAQAAEPVTGTDEPVLRSLSVRLPIDVLERAWGACTELQEAEDFRSITAFTLRAIEELCERLEAEHNNGQPYRADENPFKPGRPTTYRR